MQKLKDKYNENIVTLYDVVQSQDYYYIFMEYCSDGDLD